MKKVLLAVLTIALESQIAHAENLYCGANTETIPGTQVYDKLLFWEKIDSAKQSIRFLLKDNTLIKADELTPETFAKIEDGTLALGISFTEGKPQLFLGKVHKNKTNEINYKDTIVASSQDGNSPLLIANGVSFLCREL